MDIAAWLRELGLERYEEAFRENDIAPAVLPELMDQDLKDLDVSLGHRRLLLKAIRALADDQAGHSPLNAHLLRLRRPNPRCDRSPSGGELAARLGPEDMGAVMGAYQRATAAVVERFEGHVDKFMGDGVLACFGWPQAHEDDAERAVRAGLKLVEAVAQLKPDQEVRLQGRVGIATGQVVVGDLVGEGVARDSKSAWCLAIPEAVKQARGPDATADRATGRGAQPDGLKQKSAGAPKATGPSHYALARDTTTP